MPNKPLNVYRKARLLAGYTQEQAADAIPVHRRSMVRYEKGNDPPVDVVIRMDKIYGCKGDLIKTWLERLGFDGTIQYCRHKKSTVRTAIQTALQKIFN